MKITYINSTDNSEIGYSYGITIPRKAEKIIITNTSYMVLDVGYKTLNFKDKKDETKTVNNITEAYLLLEETI